MNKDIPLPIRYGLCILIGGLMFSAHGVAAQEALQEKNLAEAYARFYERALIVKKDTSLDAQRAFLDSVANLLQVRYQQLETRIQKHPVLSDEKKEELVDAIHVYTQQLIFIESSLKKARSSYEINQVGKRLAELRSTYKQTTQPYILKTYLSAFEEKIIPALRENAVRTQGSVAEKIQTQVSEIERILDSIYTILDSDQVDMKEVGTSIHTIDALLKDIYGLFRELSVQVAEENIGLGSLLE